MKAAGMLVGAIAACVISAPAQAQQGKDAPLRPPPAPSPPAVESRLGRSYYLYCLAQDATLHREYSSARDYLKRAVEIDPSSPSLRIELARAHARLDELDAALAESSAAAKLDPDAIEPRQLAVEIYTMSLAHGGPLDDAAFQKVVEAHVDLLRVDPGDLRTRQSLAQIYFDRGLYMQSAEILKPVVTAHPEAVDAVELLAQALMRAGDAAGARKALENAIAATDNSADLRRSLAEVLESSGDAAGSVKLLEQLVREDPGRHALHFELARAYLRTGRYNDAAMEASGLVRFLAGVDPGSGGEAALRASHVLLLDALTQGGSFDRALEAALQAERRFPGEPIFTLKRAELLFLVERDKEAEAILTAEADRQDGPDSSTLSNVLLRAGAYEEGHANFDRAVHLLERSVELDSGNAAAMNYLGYMLAEKGIRLEEALTLIRKAVLLDESNGAYLDSLGWVLFRLGQREESEEALRRAARLMPEEPVVHEHLGDLYISLDRRAEAIAAWEEALRLGVPEADTVKKKLKKARAGAD